MKGTSQWWHISRGAISIIIFASLIGIVVNLTFVVKVLRGEKTFRAEQRIEDIINKTGLTSITLSEAKRAFDENSVVFVDSRNGDEFAEGHISGAVNIPWEEFEIRSSELLVHIPEHIPLITYCGGSCESSAELAEALVEMGYTEISILLNGWQLWIEADYPVESEKR